jgi:hypothetical protein
MNVLRKCSSAAAVLGFTGMLAAAGMSQAASEPAAQPSAAELQKWDMNNDGTIDLAEAKKAASDKFDSLDTDHDGTLDRKELTRKTTFAKADSDKDGTVDKNEYLALVEARFNAADTDHDGSISQSELNTRAGKALARLL